MPDDTGLLDFAQTNSLQEGRLRQRRSASDKENDADESSCMAFGYLRGIQNRALAVEFRFLDGNSLFFPYSWLGSWWHNPSAGLLLKFTGDVATLVLIHGSNLDAVVNQSINLTDRGFQRHRITFVREMDNGEIRQVGERGPTIDRIEVAEFDTFDAMKEWIKKKAPLFAIKEG